MGGADGRGGVGRILFRVLLLAAWAAAGYYAVYGSEYSLFDLRALEDERQQVAERRDSLRAVADSLQRRAEILRTDTLAIQEVAREEHGLVREGEILYRFVPAREAEGRTSAPKGRER